MGARHFDKLLAEAIPEFEPANAIRSELAQEGIKAEKVAAQVKLPDSVHFIRARAIIRKALKEDGVADRIDKLVARLLSRRA